MADDRVAEPLEFDAWVTARSPALLRFAYLMTGSREAAEDAVQTALAKAFEQWTRVRDMHDLDAYVRRMIVNAHISWWRQVTRRESSVAAVYGTTPFEDDPGVTVPRVEAVWRLCRSLPTQQRASVVLRFYEDLTYPEIAELLHCSEATVRSHVHWAVERGFTDTRSAGAFDE
ncbi:MAG: SigE family RNA polymerase sigma factor [Nocardioidaceae bacterium]